ncbi:MAG: ferredoxin-type protein NapF [Sedimenticola sp.]
MAGSINRMQFLRGDFHGSEDPIRPPWSSAEQLFQEKCTGCGDCVTACPYQLISLGRAKYPEMNFTHYGCDFCGECVLVCKPQALQRGGTASAPPWYLTAEILSPCLSLNGVVCRACGEACEVRAIDFKLEMRGVARPILDKHSCTGCGECFAVCPIKAVKISSTRARDEAA